MGALQDRFRRALEHAAKNPTELARAVGIKQPSVHQFLRGKAQRWRYTLDAARFLGVRPEWLENGSGPMVGVGGKPIKSLTHGSKDASDSTEHVVELDVRAGAGGGGIGPGLADSDGEGVISDDATKGRWLLPPEYLRELGIRSARAFVVEVKGDSMAPTLESGDRVMVDMADKAPSPPGIFALWDGLGLVVKRLDPILDADEPRVAIISDNPKHRAYERTMDEIRIVGRVVWRASRM